METTRPTTPRPLPANRAFVVQFSAQAGETATQWSGRVEHLASGQASHFYSWKQLQEFLTRVLTSNTEKPP
jgi:hypothetical protein